jgi:pyruvate kinase
MKRQRLTKIVATLGPSSRTYEMIESLFLAGVDVFRLNFSHGTPEDHQTRAQMIRHISQKYGHPIGILQDLQGPKLRIGKIQEGGVILEPGASFVFDLDPTIGTCSRVMLPHPEIFSVLKVGMNLLLDDGRIRVRLKKKTDSELMTEVLVAGPLSSHKGVNVPDVQLPISALTKKDREDLVVGQSMQVDYIALSFVQRPEDVQELRALLSYPAHIISKLEKPAALEHLEEIIAVSDAVMVARGDLGVEMALEKVPRLQKEIIRSCRQQGKPVIVATQMLDSMIQHPIPTRAEASDVAAAVYDGVDAVMLSAESASGLHPKEAVLMMDKIIKTVEEDPFYRQSLGATFHAPRLHPAQAIAGATRYVADGMNAKAIVTITEVGRTTRDAACERPLTPLMALTPQRLTAQQLALVWGVHPYVVDRSKASEKILTEASDMLRTDYDAQDGDHVIVTSGPMYLKMRDGDIFQSGATRVLRIITLGEDI